MQSVARESSGVVMVVEDDPDQLALVSRWLSSEGFDVEEFRDAETALATLSTVLPEVVCLDVNLPGLGGLEALARMRAHNPRLPVVMLTVDREVNSVVTAIQAGAYDYLPKPLDRTKLVTTIRNAVERYQMALRLTHLEREAEGKGYGALLGRSPLMQELFRQLDCIAPSDVTVLVHGESGSGKELVARALHEASGRRRGRLVGFNCAAVPESLEESELFGHEKGAFTGAVAQRKGCFEEANGGTLFLDEVAELSPTLQAKLLRVLQERTFRRVGGSTDIRSDFRVVAASHRDLAAEVTKGRFREDLFFRLAVFELEVPPLRARGDDALVLAERFLADAARPLTLSPEARQVLVAYRWPGNVRELQNAIQRAAVVCTGDVVRVQDLPRRVQGLAEPEARPGPTASARAAEAPNVAPNVAPDGAPAEAEDPRPPGDGSLRSMERAMLEQALLRTGGNVAEVVRQLGIGRTTVYRKLKKYGLR